MTIILKSAWSFVDTWERLTQRSDYIAIVDSENEYLGDQMFDCILAREDDISVLLGIMFFDFFAAFVILQFLLYIYLSILPLIVILSAVLAIVSLPSGRKLININVSNDTLEHISILAWAHSIKLLIKVNIRDNRYLS